jgi:D-erythrose 4-phosphate dehydrogenase
VKLAINGLGRIGRNVLRAHYERSLSTKIQISAVNELADLPTLAHLIKYDSTHGRFKGKVSTSKDKLLINEDEIAVSQIDDISELNWQDIDLVLECTGAYYYFCCILHNIQLSARYQSLG